MSDELKPVDMYFDIEGVPVRWLASGAPEKVLPDGTTEKVAVSLVFGPNCRSISKEAFEKFAAGSA